MATATVKHAYEAMRDMRWTPKEKAIARRAFDLALQREFDDVIAKTKEIAEHIKSPEQLWKLESYLTTTRKEIDQKYEYRYSILPQVFGMLLREEWLKEEELAGLNEDKIECARMWAKALK